MAISMSRFSSTFFVNFLDDREMTLMAAVELDDGTNGGGGAGAGAADVVVGRDSLWRRTMAAC
jgi:hypothetical protein